MSWKILIEDIPDLSNSCEFICFPQLFSFLWVVETNVVFEKSGQFDIIAPKTKWLPSENSLSVIWRLTHVYLLNLLKLSLHCKRAIVSFILVFLQQTILPMISLSKYKWKVSSTFSILLALEFGVRQLIQPEIISHFAVYKWLLDALNSTKSSLCFCLSLDQDNQKVLPKHHLCSYMQCLCNCFRLMDC